MISQFFKSVIHLLYKKKQSKKFFIDGVFINKVLESPNEDFYPIIEPLTHYIDTWAGEKEYKKSLKKFTKSQMYLWAIFCYQGEVYNGEHSQYFSNPAGASWREALEGIDKLTLEKELGFLDEAVKRFKTPPSVGQQERNKELNDLHDEGINFSDLDTDFYKINSNDITQKRCLDYIRRHKEEFYFRN